MNFGGLYKWVLDLPRKDSPFLLGINGPQGSGKSTISKKLCEALTGDGVKAVAISIDDFYLPRTEQIHLSEKYPDNPYLQQRGYPGTHDVSLGIRTLNALKNLSSGSVTVPRYDKSMHQGKGDRAPASEWTKILGPLHLVILEGWMLGFTPVPEKSLPNQDFKVINHFMGEYQLWNQLLDGFIQLKPDDYLHVLQWRVEAEEKMKATGKPGMSKEEISRYIELFLPAYATYLPQLEGHPPVKNHRLVVPVTRERLPLT